MGCYDGAEVSELLGSYILIQRTHCVNKESIGLYRDDGLGVFPNISKPEIERKKKQTIKIFKECGLSITIQYNLKLVGFLDVIYDLYSSLYKPYRKPNNKQIYINKHFSSKNNEYLLFIFRWIDIICLIIAFACLHETQSCMDIWFLSHGFWIYLCSLHWALWFSYRPLFYIIHTYIHT